MKAQLDWQTYSNLEFGKQETSKKASQPKTLNVRNRFYDIWQMTLARLSFSAEPKVWQTQDETGKLVWSAYNPRTEKSIHRASTEEVRAWLQL